LKRLAAVLAAVLMVAVAVVVRDWLDEEQDSSPGDGSRQATDDGATLVCANELEAVCRALVDRDDELVVRIEPAGSTLEALSGSDGHGGAADVDGWLTFDPFPAMVDEARHRSGLQPLIDRPTSALARSPLVVAVWDDRREALVASCPDGDITWRCVGDVAGTPWPTTGGLEAWGAVKPSHARADQTAIGLLALASAVTSWFGTSDLASQDFRDPAFESWFERLERSIPQFPAPPRTPLDDMLFGGPATFDLTGTTEAAAVPAISRSRDSHRLSIIYPLPITVADVVFVTLTGADEGGYVRELVESDATAPALAAAGWRVPDHDLAAGLDPGLDLPASTGLPRPGVLEALRSLFVQVSR
jgi:hypothetical protein